MKKNIIILFVLLPLVSFAQDTLKGMAMIQENGQMSGLPGATVYWLDTDIGTTTNDKGWFTIKYKPEYKKLVISYIGYRTDTIEVTSANQEIHHILKDESELEEVVLNAKKKTTSVSYLSTANISTITSDELLKAACCNLSESFETNPSIDVNFSDAVTGTKQIQMLGLNSPYLLIAQENIPTVRGASQAYGLTFTPGTWIESIQITKGAGSVVNGYESIAGQINAELVKPLTDDKLFVNLYGANNGRLELNTHFNQILSDKWSTGLYIHANDRSKKNDQNDDNFLDMPIGSQINVMNRWQYQNVETGWVGFLNLRYLNDEKQAGEVDFNPDTDKMTTNAWGSEIETNRFDTALKLGYVFPEIPFQSVGFQTAYSKHNQDSYYGLRTYNIEQESVYSSLIFNSIIGDTRNKFKTGFTFTYDTYKEMVELVDYGRNENSIGAFFEYAFDNLDEFSFTAGLRADQHNKLGFFVTPRFHLRYAPWEKAVIRGSFGRGKRSANVFAENQQLFASNRSINLIDAGGKVYGLDPETAWNYGVSFLQGFNLFDKKGDVLIDFFRTDFTNQVVVDWENPQEIAFYNLDGKSFANSFQTEINYNVIENVDVRLSYKFYDISTDYKDGTNSKPLVPKHRFFANAGYKTTVRNNSYWMFDLTYNLVGKQRFPFTGTNPTEYQRPEYSPSTNLLNAQITKIFSPKFEVYIGGENITGTTQDNPIIASENPFNPYFDSTLVYAPINGANFYTGLRFKL
ncbi:TonB-dependent receptor [Urechidicola vernalis]|uniref:TonB-dependent receptor n=1 Tax=Urechidicola vernalis TaxID=3075600 RepID=A0ABU2Y0X3_9FLAO|nr:TonB-dependent receptor [Urechidicola sp. P050]MDT0551823.1 TonB-dependent receptor [Urechidicola sp. P050]